MKNFKDYFYIPKSQIYLDSAATSLKLKSVVKAEGDYYRRVCSNSGRGYYKSAIRATELREQVRSKIKSSARASKYDVVFTHGSTDSSNMICNALAKRFTKADEVLVTVLDHHATYIPWQQAAKSRFHFSVLSSFALHDVAQSVTPNTKVFCMPYVSNVTGEILPVREIVQVARARNPEVNIVLDCAQAVTTLELALDSLDVDFAFWSAHKMYAGTGLGVFLGKSDMLSVMDPLSLGGGVVADVTESGATFRDSPHRHEAGTLPLAQIAGLGQAVDFLSPEMLGQISKHTKSLRNHFIQRLRLKLGFDLELVPNFAGHETTGIVSFNVAGVHAHDLADMLASASICVRAGHHCSRAIHAHHGISSSVRVSLGPYNELHDVDTAVASIVDSVIKVKKIQKT